MILYKNKRSAKGGVFMEKTIFHIDVNSAYLSWEAIYRKSMLQEPGADLRDIPSAVGGSVEKRHGIILAKSGPAKKIGIRTGEAIWQAKQKCPGLVIVPPHYNLYERCSYEFRQLLQEYAPIIEVYSVDECWCDVSGTISLFGYPAALASLIKDKIYRELGFTVNIGISTNKLLAKVAGDLEKPNRIHTLYPDQIKEKMWPLPVQDLFYCGRATTRKLHNLGIFTIGELAQIDVSILKRMFGKHGEVIWAYANGQGEAELVPTPPPGKGYGNSTTIAFDVTDADTAKHVLLSLCESVGTRLRKDNMFANVVAVSIKNNLLGYASHQTKTLTATNTTLEIYQHACRLFDELWDGSPIRHLGVRTTDVKDTVYTQINLFDGNRYDKYNQMDRTVDAIRSRFGNDSIMRAAYLRSPIYHITGGISKEKNGPTEFERKDEGCKKLFQSM